MARPTCVGRLIFRLEILKKKKKNKKKPSMLSLPSHFEIWKTYYVSFLFEKIKLKKKKVGESDETADLYEGIICSINLTGKWESTELIPIELMTVLIIITYK